MLCRVALLRADVSEELSASTIRVTRIVEVGTLAVTSNRRTIRRITPMKEALSSSETSVLTRATQRNIPEDAFLHCHRRLNLKSYMVGLCPLVLVSGVSRESEGGLIKTSVIRILVESGCT
jgi:hypothetical protein